MKYLENDEVVKKLETRNKLEEYLEFRKENDVWVTPYIYECAVVGIDNAPLFFPEYKENVDVFYPQSASNVSADIANIVKDGIVGQMVNVKDGVKCSDEDLSECAETLGLFLCLPVNGEMQILPARYTAFSSICDRAGISGQTICNTRAKTHTKVLPIGEKAAWLTRGFSLRDSDAKTLIRDDKVSCMMSSEYEILPADELIQSLEAYLQREHPDYEYIGGKVSHEYLVCEYDINDKFLEEDVQLMFEKLGKDVKKVNAFIRFSTSDVGLSKVYARPFFTIDGVRTELGKAVEIKHDSGNTVEDFSNDLEKLNRYFKEAEDQVEELGNTEIKHVAGCLQHLCVEKKFIPKILSDRKIQDLLFEFKNKSGSAIDVYLAVCEIINEHEKAGNLTPTQYIKMCEEVSKLLYLDFKKFDYIYVEEN